MTQETMERKVYSRPITNDMRRMIIGSIKEHLKEEFKKTPVAEELESLRTEIQTFLQEEYKKRFTIEEWNTFEKYNLLQTTNVRFRLSKPSDSTTKQVSVYDWGADINRVHLYVIGGDKFFSILNVQYCNKCTITENILNSFDIDKLDLFFKYSKLSECENDVALVSAEKILDHYTTTGQLLKDHSYFKRFIREDYLYTNPRTNRNSNSTTSMPLNDANLEELLTVKE